jgi:hypothetical protein
MGRNQMDCILTLRKSDDYTVQVQDVEKTKLVVKTK